MTTEQTVRREQPEGAPRVVRHTSRITVSFPFSSITVTEDREALVELAALVVKLADAVAEGTDPAEVGAAVREEAERLRDRLRDAR